MPLADMRCSASVIGSKVGRGASSRRRTPVTCATELGLSPEPHPDSVAYLANWLQVLRSDKRAIFAAASAASKAAAYLNDASHRSKANGQRPGSAPRDATSATPIERMAA